MKNVVYLLLILVVSNLLGSCSGSQKENSENVDTLNRIDTSFLSDNNFVYKNITNTLALRHNFRYYNEKLYTDSTHKVSFVGLTAKQRLELISPFISKFLKVHNNYAVDLMQAHFISKQNKVAGLQPIIVAISGDDYGSLTLILFDKNNKYIDGYNIDGGMQLGPEDIGDSAMRYELRSYSIFEKNIITTVKIDETDFKDSVKRKPSLIDSTVLKTKIDKYGKFVSKQSLKTQYKIPYQ